MSVVLKMVLPRPLTPSPRPLERQRRLMAVCRHQVDVTLMWGRALNLLADPTGTNEDVSPLAEITALNQPLG